MGQSPVQTVPACPIQIRAHHHIDFKTDINNGQNIISATHARQTNEPLCYTGARCGNLDIFIFFSPSPPPSLKACKQTERHTQIERNISYFTYFLF